MVALVPILVALVGLLMWGLCSRSSSAPSQFAAEVGRILFLVGTFWAVAGYSGRMVKLL